VIRPRKPVSSATTSTSSLMERSTPEPRFTGSAPS
jgi:hypothetical protein